MRLRRKSSDAPRGEPGWYSVRCVFRGVVNRRQTYEERPCPCPVDRRSLPHQLWTEAILRIVQRQPGRLTRPGRVARDFPRERRHLLSHAARRYFPELVEAVRANLPEQCAIDGVTQQWNGRERIYPLRDDR